MATRSQKISPQPAQPVTRPRSAAYTWFFVVSLCANAALAGLLFFHPVPKKESPAEPVSARPLPPAPAALPPVETPVPTELTAYAALGSYVAENNHIPDLKWSASQFNAFERGIRASYQGHSYPVDADAVKLRDQISAKVQAMIEPKTAVNPIEDYFQNLREKEGVQRTTTGLHYRITQEGHGKKPGPDSTVVASYGARLPDGTSIPSLTRARARSAVRDLLPGLGEGVQMLAPGGKILVYLSPALSFRDGPWPADIPKGAPIIFFVELHEVVDN